MIRNIVILLLFSWTVSSTFAQKDSRYDEVYEENFNRVRALLGKGKTGEAYIMLRDLYKIDSTNYYTNYLMGVCYTEQNIVTLKSIKHLEYAKDSILEKYQYIPYYEKRAPIFAWYYLTKAYSQNGMCAKARWAKDNFLGYDTDFTDNSYFLKNIEKFMIDCVQETAVLRNKKRKESVVTKKVGYTLMQPLYGVQVGSFKTLVPIREEFDGMKNVEAFLDKKGTIRYTVGHFATKSQAQSLLDVIKSKGYEDAFVVNVNEEKRFSNEIIIVDNMSFKAPILGKIKFKVQVGAFRDSIPEKLAKIYLQVEDIDENKENDLTLMQVGNYETYNEAAEKKAELIAMNIPGPFIVAYDNSKKISVKAAMKHIEQKRLEKEEKANKKEAENSRSNGSRKKKKKIKEQNKQLDGRK